MNLTMNIEKNKKYKVKSSVVFNGIEKQYCLQLIKVSLGLT